MIKGEEFVALDYHLALAIHELKKVRGKNALSAAALIQTRKKLEAFYARVGDGRLNIEVAK